MDKEFPKYLVRPDDFTIFIEENDKPGTYCIKEQMEKFPNHLHSSYSYDLLVKRGWTPCKEEDLVGLKLKREEYYKFLSWQSRPDGHGGIKGGTFEEYLEKNKK